MRFDNVNVKTKRKGGAFAALLSILLAVAMILPVVPVGAVTGDQFITRIENTYAKALKQSGVKSFDGYCAMYVNWQLYLLGINSSFVGGNGCDEFANYRYKSYSNGGYKISVYPASSYTFTTALKKIASKGNCVQNVLACFSKTGTTAGQKYGHTFLIHAIVDGYVYFSESFDTTVAGTAYSEGTPIKCTIAQICAKYDTLFYSFDGFIQFEPPEGSGGGETTDPDKDPESGVDKIGVYSVRTTSYLRIRETPSTQADIIGYLSNGVTVIVTVVDNGWGKVFADGVEGWISLDFADFISDMPRALAETYDSAGKLTSRGGFNSLAEAIYQASYGATVKLTGDETLTSNVAVPEGMTVDLGEYSLNCGKYTISVSGGKVRTKNAVAMLAADPFLKSEKSGDYTIYSDEFRVEINTAGLTINENVAMSFGASVLSSAPSGVKYSLVCTYSDGSEATFPSSGGGLTFATGGIPAKKLADELSVKVCASVTSGGKTYSRYSAEFTYSPVEYVKAKYGTDASLDALLAAMMNYGAESQKYFAYNTDSLANAALSASDRVLSGEGIVRALAAPAVAFDSTAHLSNASLVLGDTVSLRFGVRDLPTGESAELLVFSASEYAALVQEAKNGGKDISDLMVKSRCKTVLSPKDGKFDFGGLTAKEYADTYYFRLCTTKGGEVKYDYVVSYSVIEYCAAVIEDGVESGIDNICRAIVDYSAAARKYFGYTVNS